MRNLLIIGAGGHGKVAADIAERLDLWPEIAFLDDNPNKENILGFPVIGSISDVDRHLEESDVFVAIGSNSIRANLLERLFRGGFSVPRLIHPSATIGKGAEIAAGTIVAAGAVIGSSTTVGRGCIVNTLASVDHDNRIGDYVHVAPGARLGGTVRIGSRSWIAINSTIVDGVTISSDCIVGAASLVLQDIDAPGVYYGQPAKKIRD